MKLYHGSTLRIPKPDIAHSRSSLDFGKGFYATSYKDQAERWALRKAMLDDSQSIVNVYDLADDLRGVKVLEFPENDEEWLEFVCSCRRGEEPRPDIDLVIGGVADDKVYEAINMYFRGLWDAQSTLKALRFYNRNDQYCFKTQRAINQLLVFVESYEVHRGSD